MKPELKVNPNPWACRRCAHSLFNHRLGIPRCIHHGCGCQFSPMTHRTYAIQQDCFALMARYYS